MTTNQNIDLSAPIWGIEHVATAFGIEVDTAHEYSYHADFPAPKARFARNLWARTEVLAWFDRLPARERTATTRTRRTTAGHRPAATATGPAARPGPCPGPALKGGRKISSDLRLCGHATCKDSATWNAWPAVSARHAHPQPS